MAKIGLLGHGIVGSGVARVLFENKGVIEKNCGESAELCAIADLRDFSGLPYADIFTTDGYGVVNDPQIDIIAECMGGVEPAFSFLTAALKAKKHVVTSNKELVVKKGAALEALARENGVLFLYEASVGGGIPILHPIKTCLAANNIQKITGILNGTTNYILTRMKDGGVPFDSALSEAKALGYCETDPSADILGHDARRKICILSHAAFGSALDDAGIDCIGIDKITKEDMIYAKELGRAIKLLAVSVRREDGYFAYVGPAMIPLGHPLSVVDGVFNAIMVKGDMLGDAMFYGRGAGALPTASAVCADIIEAVTCKSGCGALAVSEPPRCLSSGEGVTRLFLRVSGARGGSAEAEALRVFPQGFITRPEGHGSESEDFALITQEDRYDSLIEKAGLLREATRVLSVLRYEG